MITVGPVGSFLMKISPEFSKYAEQELGLKDPFAANMEHFRKTHPITHNPDGSMSIEFSPDSESRKPYDNKYIDNYIIQRNIYEFNRVMEVFGYEAAKKYCLKEGVDLTKVQPCKGADGQCNMDCIYFQGGCRNDK